MSSDLAPKHRHLVFDLIVLGAVGAISAVVYYEVTQSPSRP